MAAPLTLAPSIVMPPRRAVPSFPKPSPARIKELIAYDPRRMVKVAKIAEILEHQEVDKRKICSNIVKMP